MPGAQLGRDFVNESFQLFGVNIGDSTADKFDSVDQFEIVPVVSSFVAGKTFFYFKEVVFQFFLFVKELFNPVFQIVRVGFQNVAGCVELVFDILNEFFCSAAGQAFQTANAGGNSAFGYNVEITDIAGFFDVGSAAEFAGEEFFIVAH